MACLYWNDLGCLLWYVASVYNAGSGKLSKFIAVLALREFNKRRAQFTSFLKSNSSLTLSRYFRLMALAMTEMLFTTPLAIFVIYLNATTLEIGPWRSWDDTHFNYSRVEQRPALFWRSNSQIELSMELTRWLSPFCAIVFFSFFGFAQEAQKQYCRAYLFIRRYLPLPSLPSSKSSEYVSPSPLCYPSNSIPQ